MRWRRKQPASAAPGDPESEATLQEPLFRNEPAPRDLPTVEGPPAAGGAKLPPAIGGLGSQGARAAESGPVPQQRSIVDADLPQVDLGDTTAPSFSRRVSRLGGRERRMIGIVLLAVVGAYGLTQAFRPDDETAAAPQLPIATTTTTTALTTPSVLTSLAPISTSTQQPAEAATTVAPPATTTVPQTTTITTLPPTTTTTVPPTTTTTVI